MKLTYAVIGFGKMGRLRCDYLLTSGVSKILIYDPETSMEESDNEQLTVVADLGSILNDDSVLGVFICTPNYLNVKYTKAVLESNKHAFCEKPPARNIQELGELDHLVPNSAKGARVVYGFNHRLHASVVRMKAMIESSDFGKILWMRGRYGKSVPPDFFDNWRSSNALAGGGILIDQGIHMLDLLTYFAGGFDEVKAFVQNSYWNGDVEDNVFAILRNSGSGVTASLHSTMTQWRHLFSFEVFLERGYLVLNGLKTQSGTYGKEILSVVRNRTEPPEATWTEEELIEFEINTSWETECRLFRRLCEKGLSDGLAGLPDAKNLMELIDRIYKDGKG